MRMKIYIPFAKAAFASSLLVLAVACGSYASADVMIDIGPDTLGVESGALGLPGSPAADSNGNYGPTVIGSGISLTINNLNTSGSAAGTIAWRDKGNSTSTETLVNIGEDFVKNDSGIIRLTLSGVAAGTYNAFGYHLDARWKQSEEIKVFLQTTPGGSTFAENGTPGNADFAFGGTEGNNGVNNLTTANIEATRSAFQFVSDGTNDVIIIFDGSAASDTEVPLNGLQFSIIPEPSSVVMVLLGFIGFLLIRGRR